VRINLWIVGMLAPPLGLRLLLGKWKRPARGAEDPTFRRPIESRSRLSQPGPRDAATLDGMGNRAGGCAPRHRFQAGTRSRTCSSCYRRRRFTAGFSGNRSASGIRRPDLY